ncbi:MAG: hypothetical protein JSR09_07670 [Bacteroidetes bacterium]|nr:hypothetical protein [Bacteroidota bacterium]MBS1649571.1 hypothetical protein [Bacteroidota bacterium]
MLTEKEEAFIAYWQKEREHEKKSLMQFIKGLSRGLLIGIGIILLLAIGWYQRANMVANTQLNPFLFLFIIIIIAVFIAYFYRQYRWEQYEQQYLELMAKKKKQTPTA